MNGLFGINMKSPSPSLITQRAHRSLGTPCWLSVNTTVNLLYFVSLCVRKSYYISQDRSNYTTETNDQHSVVHSRTGLLVSWGVLGKESEGFISYQHEDSEQIAHQTAVTDKSFDLPYLSWRHGKTSRVWVQRAMNQWNQRCVCMTAKGKQRPYVTWKEVNSPSSTSCSVHSTGRSTEGPTWSEKVV